MKQILFFVITAALTACSYHYDRGGSASSPLVGHADPSQIDFAQVNAAIFQPKCARCHGGNVVASYASVKANLAEITRRMQLKSGDVMPPSGPVPNADLQFFLLWVNNGAPEVAGAANPAKPAPSGPVNPAPPSAKPEPAPLPDPAPGTFAEVEQKVFQPHCIKCHSGMLDTFEHVQPNLNAIDHVISAGVMPPSRDAALSEDERQIVLRWIAAGAPETAQPGSAPAAP